jgi:sporulation protein YlmC with PRC-barrel domain
MLLSIKQLYGNKLGASDGEIGHVKDFYFDDRNWVVRYLVADTGSWLTGRQVLISPHAFGGLHPAGKILDLKLTRKQIESSPSIALHKPVSRQYEEEYHQYFGWPYYWQGDALWGMSAIPIMVLPAETQQGKPFTASGAHSKAKDADSHLRSTQAVNGYHLMATDGILGHICDFMIDAQSWEIRKLVVKTGHRFSGKEVQIPVSKVISLNYDESTVFVNLTSDAVEHSPAHTLAPAGAVD